MKVAVLQFPGSNCDQDALFGLRDFLGMDTEYVWHAETDLSGYDAAFIPGGFTFGDYLRVGAVAARSRSMEALKKFAESGRPVVGVCNGFQILCEAGILPGALLRNQSLKFTCKDVYLKAVNRTSAYTKEVDSILRIPIAHGEGRYVCDEDTLRELQQEDRIAFQYVTQQGEVSEQANPNGSIAAIAGILNAKGNVLGMMPHPERALDPRLGSTDGLAILTGMRLVTA